MDTSNLSIDEKKKLLKQLNDEIKFDAKYIKRKVLVDAIVKSVSKPVDEYGALSDEAIIKLYKDTHLAKYPDSTIDTSKYVLSDDGMDKLPIVLSKGQYTHFSKR
jgi:hypothetical protein